MKSKFDTLILAATVLTGVLASPGRAEEQKASNSPPNWEGVWAAEGSYGPRLDGPVTLYRSGDGWIARMQGETVDAERRTAEDGSLDWSFAFADQGRFVGHQDQGGTNIEGHWLQPSGLIQNYPFATPVLLKPAGEGAFGGLVSPFPQEITLIIPLIAEASDTPEAATRYRTFLRNPQSNFGMFFRIETATVVGDKIQFAKAGGDVIAIGRSIEPGKRFTMLFEGFGQTFDFTRRSRDDVPGFYPRRWPDGTSLLPRPAETGDGWSTAAPGVSGLDLKPLTSLVSEIATSEPTALRQPQIDGLLIAHHGKLVMEEYFHGYDRDMTHDSRSSGKSLTSALLGIALRKGMIASLDEPVYPFFGGVDAFANPDPRKARMTIRHLVTMSPGLACNDDEPDSPGNENVMQGQSEQPDWYRYMLDLPMVREPGEAGFYCTGGLNLIGGIIRKASGISLPRFFQEEFAKPLGISDYQMNLSPTYDGYMGGGIRLRPRDFMKLGQLYLNEGMWNGQRIVSKEWVRESGAPHASLNESNDYGFAWWRKSYEVGGRTVETYYASGNGGQLLFVVPQLDLVALIQASNYNDGATRNAFRDRFMREYILPAALAGK